MVMVAMVRTLHLHEREGALNSLSQGPLESRGALELCLHVAVSNYRLIRELGLILAASTPSLFKSPS